MNLTLEKKAIETIRNLTKKTELIELLIKLEKSYNINLLGDYKHINSLIYDYLKTEMLKSEKTSFKLNRLYNKVKRDDENVFYFRERIFETITEYYAENHYELFSFMNKHQIILYNQYNQYKQYINECFNNVANIDYYKYFNFSKLIRMSESEKAEYLNNFLYKKSNSDVERFKKCIKELQYFQTNYTLFMSNYTNEELSNEQINNLLISVLNENK